MIRATKRLLAPIVAVAALAYLIAMVVSGALPQNRQVVEFKAAGVLEQAPESISRVAISTKDGSVAFVRRASGWANESSDVTVSADATAALDLALKIMHNSKPVRVLTREEIADADENEFGLAQPQIAVTLGTAGGVVLQAEFGASNTDGVLQFMRLKGRDQLYLMSDFVGRAWEKVSAAGKKS
jgi:hypothetical protein